MTQKTYCAIVGVLFAIGAFVHLTRLLFDWPIVVAGWTMPVWVSLIGLAVATVLAFYGLRFGFGNDGRA
jgi:hypothetical protein